VTPTATPFIAGGVIITETDEGGGPWKTTAIVVGLGSMPWFLAGFSRRRSRR
jgi:hypothetical protein